MTSPTQSPGKQHASLESATHLQMGASLPLRRHSPSTVIHCLFTMWMQHIIQFDLSTPILLCWCLKYCFQTPTAWAKWQARNTKEYSKDPRDTKRPRLKKLTDLAGVFTFSVFKCKLWTSTVIYLLYKLVWQKPKIWELPPNMPFN